MASACSHRAACCAFLPLAAAACTSGQRLPWRCGRTQLLDLTALLKIDSGISFLLTSVATGDLGTECNAEGERYEGMLVRLSDVTLQGEPNRYGEIEMDDGSGPTQLDDQLLDTDGHITEIVGDTPLVNVTLAFVVGVVKYAWSSFEVNPRFEADVGVGVPPSPPATPSLGSPPPSPLSLRAPLFFSEYAEVRSHARRLRDRHAPLRSGRHVPHVPHTELPRACAAGLVV